jgi:ribosomal protein S18 acetylase RimI-like enzyme
MENIFLVRKAIAEDAPYILEITKQVFKTYQEKVGISETIAALTETVDEVIKDIETKDVFTALYNGKVVGSVRIELFGDGTAYLSRFGVDSEFQSKGVGKILLNVVDEEMQKQNVTTLSLHTASRMLSLVRFYYGKGFYIESTTKDRGYIRALLCKEYEAVNINETFKNKIV